MCEFFGDKQVRARKEYECNAFLFVEEDLSAGAHHKFLYSEAKAYVLMKRKKGIIQKGELHRRYVWKDGNRIEVLRESLAMADICQKYNIYPDEC